MDKTTETLARYVTSLTYAHLSTTAIHEAKRRIIDSLGCGMGGYHSEPAAMARRLAVRSAGFSPPGPGAARVLGDGRATSPEMAAFANGVMVRYLDANDTYIAKGSGHASDLFPAVLAAAEAADASGRDLVLATVAGYEVYGALADQVNLRERGWDQGVYVTAGAAAGAGLIFGLSLEQMGEALAIAVTASVPTRQARAGELAMWKGVATAAAAKAGVFAAQLAREGMTGPTAAFEGKHGLWEQVTGPFALGTLGGETRRGALHAPRGGQGLPAPFAIERSNLKALPTEYHSQAPLAAILKIRQNVTPEEIEAINVRTYYMTYSEIGSEPAKWDPRTRETADHSLPYLLAVALVDGHITPKIFEPSRFLDPALRPLMARIHIEEEPAFTRQFPEALLSDIEIITKDGRRLVQRTGYPKGHARNPMTDTDVDAKFRDLAGELLGPERTESALRTLWSLDQLPRAATILDLFTLR